MKYEYVKTQEAVGMVIPHDITGIKKGEFKGVKFKKGHVITEQDVPELLSLGKEHIYSMHLEPGEVHEDEAGERIARAAVGQGVELKGPSEGKIDFFASRPGLLKINLRALKKINSLPKVIMATFHNNSPVNSGGKLAGTRVIPLVVSEQVVSEVEDICRKEGPVISVEPYQKINMGVLVTGKEVYDGKVEDAFYPMLSKKAKQYGLDEPEVMYAPDDAEVISSKIDSYIQKEVEMIVVTGGMSVDPDDVTPMGIRNSGAQIVKYGAPVLPGAMFLLAYYQQRIPVVGIPACGMFFDTTVFDLVFPRLLAGEKVTAEEISELGHGGLCLQCDKCTYPNCSFGKGSVQSCKTMKFIKR